MSGTSVPKVGGIGDDIVARILPRTGSFVPEVDVFNSRKYISVFLHDILVSYLPEVCVKNLLRTLKCFISVQKINDDDLSTTFRSKNQKISYLNRNQTCGK